MYLFKELVTDDTISFEDNIVLNPLSHVPEYVVNLYIHGSCTGDFDINNILPEDFITFLKFIDQYPSQGLHIDGIENDIIDYLEKNKITPCEYVKNICTKYQMKHLYLFINNKHLEVKETMVYL